MTHQNRRLLLLAVCAFGVLQLTYIAVTDLTTYSAVPGLIGAGLPGESTGEESTATPFVHRLTVEASNPLGRVGLRSHDLIDLRTLSPPERYRLFTRWWWLGERADMPVVRNDHIQKIALHPVRYHFPLEWWLATVGQCWVLFFAGVVSWRRADMASVRVLALCLLSWEVGLVFQSQNWLTPFPMVDAVLNSLNGFFYYGGIALLATYTTLFSGADSPWRRAAVWLSYAAAAAASVQSMLLVVGAWTGVWDTIGGWLSATVVADVVLAMPGLLSLIVVALTIATCAPAERARVTWASVPIALLFGTEGVANVTFSPAVPYVISHGAELIINYMIFFAPLGLAYTVLNRRLLDVGFALNRAMVYSGVSVAVVGIFVIFEWALGEWLGTASHAANLAISAGFALLLGLSVRAIHKRVDTALDSLFFRKRHEDEKAIREFAREAGYITDARVVVERGADVLRAHADAATVEFALDDGSGYYGAANENDPAIISLRARHDIVDLHELQTELRGEFAFPMVARGRLVGALVLGPKRSGESYAPDESDAILQLAHSIGTSLDVLTSKDGQTNGELLRSVQELASAVDAGFQMIAERLTGKDASQ
jgi:hypothetical protein